MHGYIDALLFQCIFAGEDKRSSPLVTICRLIASIELNMSLVYCVVQSSFHDPHPFVDTITKCIHIDMKAVSPALPSQRLLLV